MRFSRRWSAGGMGEVEPFWRRLSRQATSSLCEGSALLNSGTKLGAYEITGAIGAGGMGEVHRARDTKLGRDVAIKVLPEAFARDAERLARFRRNKHTEKKAGKSCWPFCPRGFS